jgi:GAF domain-containing protein
LLAALLDRIADALESDTCAFLLLDEDSGDLVARAAKGIEEEVEQRVRIPLGKGFAGRVAADRRAVIIEDVDHADVLNPILREKGIKSLLGVPLVCTGTCSACFTLAGLRPGSLPRTIPTFATGGRRVRSRDRAQPSVRGREEERGEIRKASRTRR